MDGNAKLKRSERVVKLPLSKAAATHQYSYPFAAGTIELQEERDSLRVICEAEKKEDEGYVLVCIYCRTENWRRMGGLKGWR